MGESPLLLSRRKRSGLWKLFAFFLLLGINSRSATSAATTTPSEGSCSASDSCQSTSSDLTEEDIRSCELDAKNGMCVSNPKEMFQKCSPGRFCLNQQDFGAFVLVPPVYHSEGPGKCQNTDEDCEEFAVESYGCLLNPGYMRESCPKECYVCFESSENSDSSLVKLPIGEKQTLPLEYTQDEEKVFYDIIAETASYMAEEVFAKKEFEEARRECRNFADRCAWKVASTNGEYCHDRKSKIFCGPACKACGDIILTEEEHEILDECNIDHEMNIFEDAEERNSRSSTFDDSRTLDAMFRRIVGELPYPNNSTEPYPIVPGINYTAKILSRPSLNPSVHKNMSRDLIDFHIGGPWIVVLDDFLTAEECDGLIELGNTLDRERSTIIEDEEDDFNWRTSTTAWCEDQVCENNEIAVRVHKRIGYTTGVTNHDYYEHFQLLKYETGQYYKRHHDESGDYHDKIFDYPGPRILTFFLYLNDVEDGGGTRFVDLFGDDSDIYIDVEAKKGRALLWPSMINEDLLAMDERTYHEALEVKKGEKYGANVWLHLRDFKNSDCDEEFADQLLKDLMFDEGDLTLE